MLRASERDDNPSTYNGGAAGAGADSRRVHGLGALLQVTNLSLTH